MAPKERLRKNKKNCSDRRPFRLGYGGTWQQNAPSH